MTNALTHRERVKSALAHQETDRVPIAMVCSAINPPAQKDLENTCGIRADLQLMNILSR